MSDLNYQIGYAWGQRIRAKINYFFTRNPKWEQTAWGWNLKLGILRQKRRLENGR